jgi:hypothetical protein
MAGHLGAIGFPATTREEFEALGVLAASLGQAFAAPDGTLYARWAPGAGVELWAQADRETKRIRGLNPWFGSGKARLEARLEKLEDDPKRHHDGRVMVASAAASQGLEGEPWPAAFADWRLARAKLKAGSTAALSVAAFAHALEAFETEEAFAQAPGAIPLGLIAPAQGGLVVMAGRVMAAELLENPSSKREFGWVLLAVAGGSVDVLLDEDFLGKPVPEPGTVLRGAFWTCARLARDESR